MRLADVLFLVTLFDTDNNLTDPCPELVLADCKHFTEAFFVDDQWRTPQLCDDCIVEKASQPLTAGQAEDFSRMSRQLTQIVKKDFDAKQ